MVDPLGGSYCIERLTADLEAEAHRQFDVIDAMGGMVAAIEAGYPQREIAESAYRGPAGGRDRTRTIVGVNAFVSATHAPVETLAIDEQARSGAAVGAGPPQAGTRCRRLDGGAQAR